MRIRLLTDLPIDRKHGAHAGAVFTVTRTEPAGKQLARHRKFFFAGKQGVDCAAFSYEVEVIQEED